MSKDKKFKPRLQYSPDHNDALVVALARDQNYGGIGVSGASVSGHAKKLDPKSRYGKWDFTA